MHRESYRLLRVILLAAGVHAALIVFVSVRTGRIDAHAFRSLDSREYYQLGFNLARHFAFSADKAAPREPDFWRTPGYPLFLATVIRIFGDSPAAIVVAQQVLAVINVVLFFHLAAGLLGERRGAVAAVLYLLEPYRLWYSLWLLAATWFSTVLLLAWWAWRRTVKSPGHGRAVVLGLLIGFQVLVRPVAGFVPVVVLGGLIWRSWQRADGRSLMPVVTYASGVAVVIGLWMARNFLLAGHFALSSQTGVVLAYFKAAEVVLYSEGRAIDRYVETTLDPQRTEIPHTVWEEIDRRMLNRFADLSAEEKETLSWPTIAQGNRSAVDPFEVSSALSGIAWSLVKERPVDTLVCGVMRFGSLLTFPLSLAVRPPTGVNVNRLRSALLGMLYLTLTICVVVRLVLLFRAKRDGSEAHPSGGSAQRGFGNGLFSLYFPLACMAALLLAITPQLDPRFRVPLIPMMLVIALFPAPAKRLSHKTPLEADLSRPSGPE